MTQRKRPGVTSKEAREAQARGAMDLYGLFLKEKEFRVAPSGFQVERTDLHPALFHFQRDIDSWAIARGRAAIFADCGLGKTIMQLEWGRHVAAYTGKPVLILAPLAVSEQTAREGATFGIHVTICERQSDVRPGINITNYEKLHHFAPEEFGGVVLDESSILKAYAGKTRQQIVDSFLHTPYKLACTATPAPNDYEELGNHAEFLGIMSRTEMLSTFFVHDGGDTSKWRLKGHAEDKFWAWLCEWAVMIRKPSDLGYPDDGFSLPPLVMHEHVVESDFVPEGMLFAVEAKTLNDQRAARKGSLGERVAESVNLVCGSHEKWLIWCDLNAEQDALYRDLRAQGISCVSIQGSTKPAERLAGESAWRTGEVQVLISKPSVFGYGMNWQHCRNVSFVGLSHSYESFYQAIRRVWRFGQAQEVHCHVITSTADGAVVVNIKRKEADAMRMAENMVRHMSALNQEHIRGTERQSEGYNPRVKMIIPDWLMA